MEPGGLPHALNGVPALGSSAALLHRFLLLRWVAASQQPLSIALLGAGHSNALAAEDLAPPDSDANRGLDADIPDGIP